MTGEVVASGWTIAVTRSSTGLSAGWVASIEWFDEGGGRVEGGAVSGRS